MCKTSGINSVEICRFLQINKYLTVPKFFFFQLFFISPERQLDQQKMISVRTEAEKL